MEELQLYLDLVAELGDPFTIFERDWEEPVEEPSRHALRGPADSALQQLDGGWVPGIADLPVGDWRRYG